MGPRTRAARAALLAALLCGCAGSAQRLRPSALPIDVVIVPGCPNLDDGRLSPCQIERAVHATLLWERGQARYFITSGSSVHSPYNEAESLAMAMAALGVPEQRLYLERHALHTDENMFHALLIARAEGWRSVGAASQPGHAAIACVMLESWGQPCTPFGADRGQAIARHQRAGQPLRHLRSPRVAGWVPQREQERRATAQTGRRPRPPSYLQYLWASWVRANQLLYSPPLPDAIEIVTLANLHGHGAPRRARPRDPLAGRARATAAGRLYQW